MKSKKTIELDNKAILRCALEDIWNQGKQELVEKYYHNEFVAHISGASELMTGTQGVREVLTEFKRAFPDFHEICHDLVAEEDKVTARLTICGTQEKPYRTHQSNGKFFEMNSIDIYRFSDNKIIEQWGIVDVVTMATALGWDNY
jgi:steroid delta-isomerase-like uncharacterized protein